MSKRKIFNDPVYGFIPIPGKLIMELIDHPMVQRLRRIKQLGLTDMVYPGALHTRFHHAVGAMHLMGRALDVLRSKGTEISEEEKTAAQAAILLHDVGHGPFSHALEFTLMQGIRHESLSFLIMKHLNRELGQELALTLRMFQNTYERTFFHQLISSQLDIDRLDYLKRDSFFTGVSEGSIGLERIVTMLNVVDDNIVVEEKGLYSIENFLNARRLMYWQVYLHKTSVSAEKMLINLITRARDLTESGEDLPCSPVLGRFLRKRHRLEDFQDDAGVLEAYGNLDDYDIWGSVKSWQFADDHILRMLSRMLLERKLFRIQLNSEPLTKEEIREMRHKIADELGLLRAEARYLISHGELTNKAYIDTSQKINILTKRGEVIDVAEAADLPNIKAISKIVKKYYLCSPKNVSL